jgi:short-subunit dehydrogenase
VEVTTVVCDLATREGVETLCQAAQGRPIAMLINNAGIGLGRAFAHQDPDQLDEMLALNVQAPTRLMRKLLPQLIEQKGTIINVASQAGFQPVPYMASYAATKSYLLHLSEALHQEFKADGVHVLAVCPAATDTAFFKVANMSAQKTHFSVGTVDEVVETTMQALARKQSFIIPGWRNKCMTFMGRFAPRAMIAKMAGGLVGEAHRN